MSRKKKSEIEEQSITEHGDFVYCGWRHCPHTICLRHHINTPFNVMILMKKFNPDKDWNCKDKVV